MVVGIKRAFSCDYSQIEDEEPYRGNIENFLAYHLLTYILFFQGCHMSIEAESPTAIMNYTGMTIQFCIELCRTLGSSQLSALQVDQCICIEETPFEMGFVKIPEAFCNNHCSGNPLQKCGAENGFISVYNTSLYDPVNVGSCLEYFKLGMIPTSNSCVTLKIGQDTTECCWNSLLRQDMVTISSYLFH